MEENNPKQNNHVSIRTKIANTMIVTGFAASLIGIIGSLRHNPGIQEIPELARLETKISKVEYVLENKDRIEFESFAIQEKYDNLLQQSNDLLEQEKAILQSQYDDLKQQPEIRAVEDSNKGHDKAAGNYGSLLLIPLGLVCGFAGAFLEPSRPKKKNK